MALTRSLVRKGANFNAAMAFQVGSTNLVIELGPILGLLVGWQFTAAEFVGGPVMIVLMALLLRRMSSHGVLGASPAARPTQRWPAPWRATRRWT